MFEDFRLKVFVEIVREGSFTKAAAALRVSQPTVSQIVFELEKEAGVALFERQRRGVLLTGQGRVFLKYAEQILRDYSSLSRMFSVLPDTVVRVAASEEVYAHLIAPALEDFKEVHPNVTFEPCLFDEADLHILLRPASAAPFDTDRDAIMKITTHMSPVEKTTGSPQAAREKSSFYEILFRPSASFSATRLCRLLKEFLISRL